MRVLGLIPARGGSKGVPGKNTKMLGGRPLIEYTAEAALSSKRLSRVILSTEDEAIAEAGRKAGVDVPFRRPAELANDSAPMLPVIQHAVRTLEEQGDRFDAICLLQPTNPFRRSEQIDACVDLLEERNADAVVAVLRVPTEYNPHWVYEPDAEGWLHVSTGEAAPIPRRQELPPAFHREGSIYVTRRNVVMERNSLYGRKLLGYSLPADRSVNIDTVEDWEQAEAMIARGRKR
jgi:CMP-N,N'-diacetyllegionaminic acid synthase